MKKTVILILAVLPIFLIITIAFAGKILSFYQHIPVEKIQFVDILNNPYESDDTFELNMGDEKSTKIRIFPELASNKDVVYESSNEDICTVDENGKIIGVYYGSAQVTVTTKDSNKKAVLEVLVKAEKVMGVELKENEINMVTEEVFKLEPIVHLPPAKNKAVTYMSDNPLVVKVSPTGELSALSEGTAIITVVTVDGGYSDTCTVTVTKGIPALIFTLEEQDFITKQGVMHYTTKSVINLYDYIQVDPTKINVSDVKFVITSGSSRAELENGVLTLKQAGAVKVKAYVGNVEEPDYTKEIILTL